jgi:hypothetical protein
MADEKKKDGIEVVADGVIFRVADKEYKLPKASKREMTADIEAVNRHLQASRRGPIEAILPELERLKGYPQLQQDLMDRAYADLKKGDTERHVSNDDISAWLDTMPGIKFTMGLAFRRVYPEMTDEDLLEIIVKVGAAEMEKARDAVQGEALKKLLPQGDVERIFKE